MSRSSRRSFTLPVGLCLGLLVALSLGCQGSEGSLEVDRGRIIGGQLEDGLPAVGSITYNGRHLCTGTLVGPRKVLTAGHCVQGRAARAMRFVIGPRIDQAQAVVPVAAAAAHPAFNRQTIQHDIAQLQLSADAKVPPMGVLGKIDASLAGQRLYFVGYGVADGHSRAGSGIKRGVWIRVSRVSSTTFSYSEGGRNTCGGDSGGPAFYRNSSGELLVAGVTSYGDPYCTRYGVDTRVDRYLGFLGLSGGGAGAGSADPCRGETFRGRCAGETVVWCEEGQVKQQDCATLGRTCAFNAEKSYFGCAAEADPCQGETFEGRCAGQTVVWCEDDRVRSQSCAAAGRSCGWNSSKGYYGCL